MCTYRRDNLLWPETNDYFNLCDCTGQTDKFVRQLIKAQQQKQSGILSSIVPVQSTPSKKKRKYKQKQQQETQRQKLRNMGPLETFFNVASTPDFKPTILLLPNISNSCHITAYVIPFLAAVSWLPTIMDWIASAACQLGKGTCTDALHQLLKVLDDKADMKVKAKAIDSVWKACNNTDIKAQYQQSCSTDIWWSGMSFETTQLANSPFARIQHTTHCTEDSIIHPPLAPRNWHRPIFEINLNNFQSFVDQMNNSGEPLSAVGMCRSCASMQFTNESTQQISRSSSRELADFFCTMQ